MKSYLFLLYPVMISAVIAFSCYPLPWPMIVLFVLTAFGSGFNCGMELRDRQKEQRIIANRNWRQIEKEKKNENVHPVPVEHDSYPFDLD